MKTTKKNDWGKGREKTTNEENKEKKKQDNEDNEKEKIKDEPKKNISY
jgi:hypothetical protein